MYSTDLSNTQWQFIKKSIHIEDRKRKYDLRRIWNAINYLVKTGCQWRMIPEAFESAYDFAGLITVISFLTV